MKQIIYKIFAAGVTSLLLISCKKDLAKTTMQEGVAPSVTLSPATLVLTSATGADTVETISWSKSDYGFSAAVNYTVQVAKAGTSFAAPTEVNVGSKAVFKYVGAVLNDLAIGAGIAPGTTGALEIRIKSALSAAKIIYSDPQSLTVTTYAVEFPALLVEGGNSWVTPGTRTNGFLLTSVNFDSKYEGYINLPNADGYGGDAFKLVSSSSGTSYGWGGTDVTMSVGGGNLWLTPAPNYMKVNADINALTLNFTPVQFFLSGDHNAWSTSATPMTFDPGTNTWIATGVTFTAGNKFVFTSNGSYDISYKTNDDGKLIYAGPPNWAGNNIDGPAGTYTVILDLSGGDGSYTYRIQ